MIEWLTFKNYRQYKDRTIQLDGSLIGIVGPNGSGKSNLLLACEYLLTGRVPGKNKEDLVSWGEKTGSITGGVRIDGVLYTVMRGLTGSKAEIDYQKDGQPAKIKGVSEVNDFLQKLTGIDAVTARIVFPHQKDLDGILFDEAAVRQRHWLALCGLGETAAIHTKLGQLLSTRVPETADFSAQLQEAEAWQTTSELELATAIAEMQKVHRPTFAVADAQKLLRELETARVVVAAAETRLADMRARNTELKAGRDKAQAELKALINDLYPSAGTDTEALAQCEQEIAQTEKARAAAEQYLRQLAQAEQAQARLQAAVTAKADWHRTHAPPECATVEAVSEKYDGVLAALQEASKRFDQSALCSRLSQLEHILSLRIADDCVCPLCRQKIVSLAEVQETIQQEAVMVTEQIEDLRVAAHANQNEISAVMARRYAALRAITDYNVAATRLHEAVARAEAAAAATPEATGNGNEAAEELQCCTALLEALRQSRTDIARLGAAKAQASERIKQNEQEQAVCQKIIDENRPRDIGLKARFAAFGVDSEGALRLTLEEQQKLAAVYQAAEANVANIRGRLNTIRSSVASLQAKQEEQARIRTVKAAMMRVRDWFHYDVGPKAITAQLLETVVAATNEFLIKFGSRFSVLPDQTIMSMRYLYNDGTVNREPPPDITQLSGGESIALAVAFRFAVHCLFAGKLSLLTLDEPTVYLDKRNITNFLTLLETVKSVARNMGLQVMMSTHEVSVGPLLDTVIETTATDAMDN